MATKREECIEAMARALKGPLNLPVSEFTGDATAAFDACLKVLMDATLEMKLAGAKAITAEIMRANANYDGAIDCWAAMLATLQDNPQ